MIVSKQSNHHDLHIINQVINVLSRQPHFWSSFWSCKEDAKHCPSHLSLEISSKELCLCVLRFTVTGQYQ
jgi:hypothetical protein